MTAPSEDKKSQRGFATLVAQDPARMKAIAAKGGRTAHARGTAHEFNAEEAREAGRKGGVKVSQDREHMAAIGRKGGSSRARRGTPAS